VLLKLKCPSCYEPAVLGRISVPAQGPGTIVLKCTTFSPSCTPVAVRVKRVPSQIYLAVMVLAGPFRGMVFAPVGSHHARLLRRVSQASVGSAGWEKFGVA
jgi:hypothetical protein